MASCNTMEYTTELHEGDLLFQIAGDSEFAQAIAMSTASLNNLDFVHVGIYTESSGQPAVIEASSEYGVVETPLNEFLNESPQVNNKPGVVAMRVDKTVPVDKAVERAKSYIGRPYDWEFEADNGKVYCSELVQYCYLYDNGQRVFKSVPMNFLDPQGHMPQFWLSLFASLGKTVPHGELGTNPNSIFRSPQLTMVNNFYSK